MDQRQSALPGDFYAIFMEQSLHICGKPYTEAIQAAHIIRPCIHNNNLNNILMNLTVIHKPEKLITNYLSLWKFQLKSMQLPTWA